MDTVQTVIPCVGFGCLGWISCYLQTKHVDTRNQDKNYYTMGLCIISLGYEFCHNTIHDCFFLVCETAKHILNQLCDRVDFLFNVIEFSSIISCSILACLAGLSLVTTTHLLSMLIVTCLFIIGLEGDPQESLVCPNHSLTPS